MMSIFHKNKGKIISKMNFIQNSKVLFQEHKSKNQKEMLLYIEK